MVLSVKKTLTLVMCVSTLAASEKTQTSALRTRPHRDLTGIHHPLKYAPKVVKQSKKHEPDDNDDTSCSSSDDSLESYDSYEVDDKNLVDVELKDSEEMELNSVQNVDLEITDSFDADIELIDDESLEYDGDGNQVVDIISSSSLDFYAMANLDSSHRLDSDIDWKDGTLDVELGENEDYRQDLEFEDDEEVDEIIDVPEGAKSIHLRMHKGNVDLDIIKDAVVYDKKKKSKDIQKKKQTEKVQTKEEKKEEKTGGFTTTKEATVSYAAETKDWIQNNGSKPAFLGGIIGAAVGIVGVVGVAIAKSWKRASEKSVLAEDVSSDAEADAEVDEDAVSESDSDSDSDEDVEADVTALTEEDAMEEKKASVVEGSV